ncbi:hypothetical protein [Microbacterium candidum]|uniref:Uncharacterized protein n=1 Tax=Microbacterium candidum TaxID=3041922 RepID=A0ABT7MUT1_9MICO|nr:hypothetical protein [Microbacterium sp. ASV49]MDL9978209.1 hypothetical protein [Microbacterium sp. ASV49]
MKQIVDYTLSVGTDWHELPAEGTDPYGWARQIVVDANVEDPAAELLEARLRSLAEVVGAQIGDGGTAAVWVPVPESGYAAALMSITVWNVGDGGYVDRAAFLAESVDDAVYGTVWEGELPAGPFAARHAVRLRPREDGDEHDVVEMTEFVVFPDDAAQFVQIVFSAENITAFEDMPGQTEAVARTLGLAYGVAA